MVSTEAREPQRFERDYSSWDEWPEQEKASFFRECDREIDEIGVVVLAGAIPAEKCDLFIEKIKAEIASAVHIEQMANERRIAKTGHTVYNLQARDPLFMDQMTFAPVVDFFRRYLGADMTLYSSEARVTPPRTGNGGWHFDGYDRIPNYFMSMNSLHYLCDSDKSNGATRYIPGTHKNFIPIADADQYEAKYINVRKGDVVLFNPYLVHSGSANHTDKTRPILINYYCRSYMKQEFNYPRMYSYIEARKLTEDQRKLLGFNTVPLSDLHELYRLVSCRNALADQNPYRM